MSSSSDFCADVALVTTDRYMAATAQPDDWYLANILREDALLGEALTGLGLSFTRVAWNDDSVDWSRFRIAVIRSTWDYHENLVEFQDWLERVDTLTTLCNPLQFVRWNMDKHYLADLSENGIPIVPSKFLEKGQPVSLPEIVEETGWKQAIFKPCVSAAARETYRVDESNIADRQAVLSSLLERESLIFQPFMQNVVSKGEDTLMVFGDTFTHAVRKTPKQGDFRVQDDHGGSVRSIEPEPEQVELALRAMKSRGFKLAYGRVDMVRDDEDRWRVMELEAIEPELWLRFCPEAARPFAAAIAEAALSNDSK